MIYKLMRLLAQWLLFFVGITALYGGSKLLSDPSGQALGLPEEYLEELPFGSFFIPGMALFVIIGVSSLLVCLSVAAHVRYYGWYVAAQGLVLAGWVLVQLILLGSFVPVLHTPYFSIAMVLMVVGFWLQQAEKKRNLIL